MNLPCPEGSVNQYPNPYVKVELGGRVFMTTHVSQNLHPIYYQSFESAVDLTEDLSVAPEISVRKFAIKQSSD